jgi:isoleucyl-tRNA synthetase
VGRADHAVRRAQDRRVPGRSRGQRADRRGGAEKGVDAWSDANAQALLGNKYDAADYERIVDILDVWFDSGSTHAFVLESGRWPDLSGRPTCTSKGSDQHRGWFQSSLLESCGTRGRAPYKAVLTHGSRWPAKA